MQKRTQKYTYTHSFRYIANIRTGPESGRIGCLCVVPAGKRIETKTNGKSLHTAAAATRGRKGQNAKRSISGRKEEATSQLCSVMMVTWCVNITHYKPMTSVSKLLASNYMQVGTHFPTVACWLTICPLNTKCRPFPCCIHSIKSTRRRRRMTVGLETITLSH